jgi:hypothetical protein
VAVQPQALTKVTWGEARENQVISIGFEEVPEGSGVVGQFSQCVERGIGSN